MYKHLSRNRRLIAIAVVTLTIMLASGGGLSAFRTASTPGVVVAAPEPHVLNDTLATAPLISYQARLLNPATGRPVDDGSYPVVFGLYTAAEGSAPPIWTETKSVEVEQGSFSTLLGDSTPLDAGQFNGQDLWLGIKVDADPEATPRARITYSAYALYALRAADDSVTEATIADYQKTISFPANALSFEESAGSTVSSYGSGIRWQATFSGGASLQLARPHDWDGKSDVVLRIYFMPRTNTSGTAGFFIRPRAYDAGDQFSDVPSISSSAVAVGQALQVKQQDIVIPANRFGDKSLWYITLQRFGVGTGETYPDEVIVLAVELTYTANR